MKVNIVCDKEAETRQLYFKGKQKANLILPNEVGVVLDVGGAHIFQQTNRNNISCGTCPKHDIFQEIQMGEI